MQFYLDTEQLNLVANLLLETNRISPCEQELTDKILARDLRLDSGELERLAEIVCEKVCQLKDQAKHAQNSPEYPRLQGKLTALLRVQEKVNEACVMF